MNVNSREFHKINLRKLKGIEGGSCLLKELERISGKKAM